MSEWVHVAELKELTRRRKKQVTVDGNLVALFLIDGEVFALDDVCVHKTRSLSKGTILGGEIICPGHQWKFDPRTGRPEDQPGCQATWPVQVSEEGAIMVGTTPASPRESSGLEDNPDVAATGR